MEQRRRHFEQVSAVLLIDATQGGRIPSIEPPYQDLVLDVHSTPPDLPVMETIQLAILA
jgi:hypothetical protein